MSHIPRQHAGPATTTSSGEPDIGEVVERLYRDVFVCAPYYSSGRTWDDYAPAYRYGFQRGARIADLDFEDAEAELAHGWAEAGGRSRLVWAEARGAVRDAWRQASRQARLRSATHSRC